MVIYSYFSPLSPFSLSAHLPSLSPLSQAQQCAIAKALESGKTPPTLLAKLYMGAAAIHAQCATLLRQLTKEQFEMIDSDILEYVINLFIHSNRFRFKGDGVCYCMFPPSLTFTSIVFRVFHVPFPFEYTLFSSYKLIYYIYI